MNEKLPTLLSFNGGFVDTAGFLALQGLFTAHVTGNFVTLGATLVSGTSGAIAKLAALPVFCIAILLTTACANRLSGRGPGALRMMLLAQATLLTIGAVLGVSVGPFPDSDALPALATGMTLVVAMAVQNALHRLHLADAPPTTLMTGTVTQIMIALGERLGSAEPRPPGDGARLRRMAVGVAAFAAGCGVAAGLYLAVGLWCLFVPPVIVMVGWACTNRSGSPADAR
ncbi:MAG: hypothetical protein GAK33_03613 [Burkholderia lata]|uniref:DUF1275 domain-containing protein n=1 Tax=Burkholderia lata (strain ATCC 17760 / DSM 23089 / LMG 22485 / NCIMB 9086 / R18194 / 383) TaxID=482957 RepID=A0A833PS90_BURL3|nr:YoaK family protein [Burkholderia lata]KAF1036571.1 MAG: hypothetical protein GAK33_03613 [Burkholderia lata]